MDGKNLETAISDGLDMITARCHAQEIANRMESSYYLRSAGSDWWISHQKQARAEFLSLAAVLGYSVERIEPSSDYSTHNPVQLGTVSTVARVG